MRRVALTLVVLALAAIVVAGAMNLVRRSRTVREIQSLRDTLYASRLAADSCRWSLATQERRLQRYTAFVDSLRTEVRDFEALDVRGVPEERYDEYLEQNAPKSQVASGAGKDISDDAYGVTVTHYANTPKKNT